MAKQEAKAKQALTQEEFHAKALEAGKVFSPTAPIDEKSLFAGRIEQIRQAVDAINQKGQHAIIFGERGVGKTSLSNVLHSFLIGPNDTGFVLAPRVNCDSTDTFESVLLKALTEMEMQKPIQPAGVAAQQTFKICTAADLLDGPVSPDGIRKVMRLVSENSLPILIFDEFDRLSREVKRAFADMIKTLSDHAIQATVIVVGVADSVDQLIEEHHSVERALVQIRMPRMSKNEIHTILLNGLNHLEMTIDGDALARITILAQGLPHYAHLLGLYSSRTALDESSLNINEVFVRMAIERALNGTQQSIKSTWHQATMSPRKDNLFADVLIACALAKQDELGFFAAQDVRGPMRDITGKQYEIPSFAQHLNEFCEVKRGPVLHKTGTKRRYRFRFVNPLMQPFVIMQGFADGRVTSDLLNQIYKNQK